MNEALRPGRPPENVTSNDKVTVDQDPAQSLREFPMALQVSQTRVDQHFYKLGHVDYLCGVFTFSNHSQLGNTDLDGTFGLPSLFSSPTSNRLVYIPVSGEL